MQIFISYPRTKLGIAKHLAAWLARLDDADFELFRDAKQWSEGALDLVFERFNEVDVVLSIVSDAALVIRRHVTGRYFVSEFFLPDDDQPDPGGGLDVDALSATVRDISASRIVVLARDGHGKSHCIELAPEALAAFMLAFSVPGRRTVKNDPGEAVYSKIRVSADILYGVDSRALCILSDCGILQVHEIADYLKLTTGAASNLKALGSNGVMPGFDVARGGCSPPISNNNIGATGSGIARRGFAEVSIVSNNDLECNLPLFVALLSHVGSDRISSR